jgi:hypothetical protein
MRSEAQRSGEWLGKEMLHGVRFDHLVGAGDEGRRR